MPTLHRDCDIHFDVAGAGPGLVMLPGLGGNATSWGPLLAHLAERRTCITVEHRGSGMSGRPGRFWAAQTMADDVAAVMDELGVPAADVVGYSLGGVVTQALAARHPERVTSLALLQTSPGLISYPPSAIRFARMGLERAVRRWQLTAAAAAEPHPELSEAPPQRLQQVMATLTHVGVLDLRRIHVPTLIVHGAADPMIPAANARLLNRLISGSELVLVPGASHQLIADAYPQVSQALDGFLDI